MEQPCWYDRFWLKLFNQQGVDKSLVYDETSWQKYGYHYLNVDSLFSIHRLSRYKILGHQSILFASGYEHTWDKQEDLS